MNTFLGASHLLDQSMIDEAWIADAEILYLEGYLWDPELSRAAMRRAIDVSHAAGRKVAFTLSDAFIIDRHGPDFRALIAEGLFDRSEERRGGTECVSMCRSGGSPVPKK